MAKLKLLKIAWVAVALYAAGGIPMGAQTYTRLIAFDELNGANPALMSLTQGEDGSLYGTTEFGSFLGEGTIFKIAPHGLETVYSFCLEGLPCVDGSLPSAGLALVGNDSLYGTTAQGGDPNCSPPSGCGTIFKIDRQGALTTLHVFEMSDGYAPSSALIQGADGFFYGTTTGGGLSNKGTVFRMSPAGTLVVLHSFTGGDGAQPESGLVQATDGEFYGTTNQGGSDPTGCEGYGCGTVFRIKSNGEFTMLYSLCSQPNCADGALPVAGLTQGTDGNLYGTTTGEVAYGLGTIFRITLSGALTTLYSFCAQPDCTDGAIPIAGLTLGSDGTFYGTTQQGGTSGRGAAFSFTPAGALTTLYSFCSQKKCADGSYPYGGITQGTDGNLYGTTYTGGAAQNDGVIYRISVGLSPFVGFVRPYGKIGQTSNILGQALTGTTNVSFNGVPATFTVVSDTFIKATVPQRATTGYVTVTTPTGVLTSNVPFHVIH
jgi:uncharacterized repeat protein (TIGR03803 family)